MKDCSETQELQPGRTPRGHGIQPPASATVAPQMPGPEIPWRGVSTDFQTPGFSLMSGTTCSPWEFFPVVSQKLCLRIVTSWSLRKLEYQASNGQGIPPSPLGKVLEKHSSPKRKERKGKSQLDLPILSDILVTRTFSNSNLEWQTVM